MVIRVTQSLIAAQGSCCLGITSVSVCVRVRSRAYSAGVGRVPTVAFCISLSRSRRRRLISDFILFLGARGVGIMNKRLLPWVLRVNEREGECELALIMIICCSVCALMNCCLETNNAGTSRVLLARSK